MGYIKLNRENFFHNLDYFSSLTSKDKLSIALKDNAYGHGIEQIATLSKEYGIKHIFVRDCIEASIAKKYNFESILVLYDIPKSFDKDIVISINSLSYIKSIPKKSKVELKIDTGMNRNGIDIDQIELALKQIEEKNLILYGVFTHFCCADEDDHITKVQENRFLEVVEFIKSLYKKDFRIHCANSAAVHKVDISKYDLARVGIGAYGYLDIKQEEYLKPVLSLHANKISTKMLQKGEHIGYGAKGYIAPKDMVVSNYDIGYGDGFFRLSENKKANIANGLDILGRVSMDSFSVESYEDEVCVFNNVTNLAKVHNTIKYEILTNLKPSIKRIIV